MKDKVTPIVLMLVALALLAALSTPQTHIETPEEAQPAPDFEMIYNGQPARLSDLRGQVGVLNFWASWCPPCVAEMPSLQRLHDKMAARGVIVLGINEDDARPAFDNFMRGFRLTFPNHHDPQHIISNTYGTFKFPETFIIDKNGILVKKVIGAWTWDDPQVIAFLEELL